MGMHEIRVMPLDHDPEGQATMHEINRTMDVPGLEAVDTTKIYRLEGISEDEARLLAERVLTDPLTETATVNGSEARDYSSVEVAYLPGVTNPEATSIVKAASDLGLAPTAADSAREYHFRGEVSREDIEAITGRLLVNEHVQRLVTERPSSLTFEAPVGPVNTIALREASEQDLMALSKDKLFLTADEMRAVQSHFKKLDRDPTDAELEIIAAAWSEHCGHKTFKADIELADGTRKAPLIKRIMGTARKHFGEKVLSAFGDNSGVLRFPGGYAICAKVETHNSPSALDPYGGAMTGSGGVFRDIVGTGKGAKTIISTDMFCLAPPDLADEALPPGTLRPDYIQRGVVRGVRDYGNRMGIPTGNGSLHFHPDFRAKPSVIVGAYGIMPEKYAQKGSPEVGDLVVVVGGRTGRDGIHGATFSSGEMTDKTAEVNSSAVQIGNAIEEKRMFDAILQARDAECIRAITDCGAAGFSSAIGEMGEEIGVTVDLAKAPLKYPGLAPWEIFLSESQERMVLAIPPEKIEEFNAICHTNNVEASVLGEFDGSHTLTVNYGEQNVAELDYDFISNGLPDRIMKADWQPEQIEEKRPLEPVTPQDWLERLELVMGSGNVSSKEAIVRQYDHNVQGGTIVGPFGGKSQEGPNDAMVVRPLLDQPHGVVVAHGMNPILNRLNPYEGSKWAIAEAMANFVSAGGNPDEAGLINNFIWPFPDEAEMGSLDRSVDAITDMMDALEAPVISGKDSLSSTYRGNGEVIKIPPVLCMSVFGSIDDVEKTMTTDIKKPGSTLVLVGQQSEGMGGSAYYEVSGGQSSDVPAIDPAGLRATLRSVHEAILSGDVLACHDVSEGGVAAAVSEMAIGGACGAELTIPQDRDAEHLLFNETAGCFVMEIENEKTAADLFSEVPHTIIGKTTATPDLEVAADDGTLLFATNMQRLKKIWQQQTKELFA